MQCGPVRHRVDARAQAAARPLEHTVLVRPTAFHPASGTSADKRIEFQALYQLFVNDETRNRAISDEIVQAVREGRSPLVLTERSEHLDRFESVLSANIRHVVVLRGGMGKKQRQAEAERLAAIPAEEGRVILSTGKYIGEGFDSCKRPAISCCVISPRTSPRSWTQCSTGFCGQSVPGRDRLWRRMQCPFGEEAVPGDR